MRVLFFSPQTYGVAYYRTIVPRLGLSAKGIESDFVGEVEEATIGLLGEELEKWLLDNAKNYDIIHSGYSTDSSFIAMLAALREYSGARLVTDIDDDILNVPSYNTGFKAYHGGAQERRVAQMMLRISDAVTVTNRRLADVLRKECRSVHVLPNCNYPPHWAGVRDPRRDQDKHIRFMTANNIGRLADLDAVRVPLERAMEKYENMRLFFMGCVPQWALQWMPSETDPRENRAFVISPGEPALYRSAIRWIAPDVFFSPVECNAFNRSKSCIKAYDAAMSNAAFLCTDWDTYEEVPQSCAVKVRGESEWLESIEQLVEDADLRKRLCTNMAEWIPDRHIDSHAEKWVNCYQEVLADTPVATLEDVVRPAMR